MIEIMSYSEKIKKFRTSRKLTHQQFADAVGVSRGSIQQWERGVTAPKRLNQPAVAKFMGVSIAELMSDDLQILEPTPQENKPNQGPAQAPSTQGAININTNQVMQAKDVVEALAGLLAGADPGRLESVTGMLRDLARTPTDDELIKALTGLLGKKTFAEKHQKKA